MRQFHLPVAIWGDDFDPSGSNKKNKNNAWVLTLTFMKRKDQFYNSNNKYIIALREKGIDH
eukprot:4285031-Ditylum_brightwellii.AAC.1